MLQQVNVYRPDDAGNLKLVKIISRDEVIKLADLKLNTKKFNKKRTNNELFVKHEPISDKN